MLLNGKTAVIYGANNPTGASVARAFAREGATVYLAGRSRERLEPVAREIVAAGGAAEFAEVDPLDLKSVSDHLHQVAVDHGTVDISLNLAFVGMEGAARLCNLTHEQFDAATFTRIRSNFVTSAAAVKVMAYQGGGTILATAVPEKPSPFGTSAGQAIGSAAIGALCEQLRLDVGSFGVQIVYVPDVAASEEELIEKLFVVLAGRPTTSPSPSGMLMGPAASTDSPQTEAPAGAATG
ncbi:MAG: SDR family oxidoreductase [Thermoplasmata archaeon]|nr:SDR family oxidoreductase [Thermoplasmata archaeon]MCI4356252.1 SDR family oxidoreductase [Thermoplasmata archaeon]